MKEGMKMSGFLIGIVTVAVIIYCGILYVRKVEKRSFLSYLMERLLFLFVKPLAYPKVAPLAAQSWRQLGVQFRFRPRSYLSHQGRLLK